MSRYSEPWGSDLRSSGSMYCPDAEGNHRWFWWVKEWTHSPFIQERDNRGRWRPVGYYHKRVLDRSDPEDRKRIEAIKEREELR